MEHIVICLSCLILPETVCGCLFNVVLVCETSSISIVCMCL